MIDPVCVFHGKKASEHVCIVCDICFKTLEPEDCAEDSSGQKWNICKGQCATEAGIHARG